MKKDIGLLIKNILELKHFELLENNAYGGFLLPEPIIEKYNALDNGRRIPSNYDYVIILDSKEELSEELSEFLFRTDPDLIQLIKEEKIRQEYPRLNDISIRIVEPVFYFDPREGSYGGLENISISLDFFKN